MESRQSAPSILMHLPSDKQRSETVLSYGLHTNEIPPNIDFYRTTSERTGDVVRPTMNQLIEGAVPEKTDKRQSVQVQVEDDNSDGQSKSSEEKPQGKKFGWIEGVFVRCLQNIIGVILFLRLAWVAGQCGLLLGSLIIILASVVTTITALSTSAITSNGEIKGGGVYYMISRTLGPEFGGSIGIIFACANAVGGALYVVGFAETVKDMMHGWHAQIFDGGVNDIRLIGVVTCFLLMGIIVIGISIESKMQQIMLIPFFVSVLSFIVGSFIHTETKELHGFTGYKWDTFSNNLLPTFRDGQTFFSVFSIYFPAATGIMAGANISGDLKNPQTAIPKGTIFAIFASTIIYLLTLFCTGSTFVTMADGINIPEFIDGSFVIPECDKFKNCTYGLIYNTQVLTELSAWGPLIEIGIFASTLCSALASLVSAPKVLQAVALDEMFPKIKFFAKSYGKNGDPRRAYALTFLITLCMILIGDLDAIAPIISNFFLCTYALVNYACFDASFSDSPGFRPAFKYYSMWVSLLGALVCVVIMFIMEWVTALVTFLVFGVLFLFLKKNKPDVNWGSSTQANQYKYTLGNLYSMSKQEEHVKNFRPQILLMSGDPSTRPGLVDFAASITRGSCLMICANVLTHEPTHKVYSMMRRCDIRAASWLKERGLRSFCVTVSAKDLYKGSFNLTQMVGIGKMSPNILMLGYKSDWTKGQSKLQEMNEYMKSIQAGFDKHMSVVILRNRDEGFDVLDNEKRDKRMSIQYPKGEPPKGRLSLNPERAQEAALFQGGAREFFERIKRRQKNVIVDSTTDKPPMEQQYSPEMTKRNSRKPSTDMAQLPSPFCVVLKKATIDVWWLSDDGGLTLLLPHLLTLSKSYLEGAKLRVFTLSTTPTQLETEQASMAALMNKFRISYKDLHVISDIGGRPTDTTISTFNTLIAPFRSTLDEPEEGMITEEEMKTNKGKTYRHLRCGELLHKHSEEADLIVMTLPVPTKGAVSSSLYLAWLEMMTRSLPPTLLVRGNHNSVLTFYS